MVVFLFEVFPCSKSFNGFPSSPLSPIHLQHPPLLPQLLHRYLFESIINPSLRDPPITSIHQASSFRIHNPSPRDLQKPISHQSNSLTSYCISFYHPLIHLPLLDSFYSTLLLPSSLKILHFLSFVTPTLPLSFSHSESLS